jgi:hypothetical protein
MKPHDVNAAILGKLMVLSALVEAGHHEAIVEELVEMYQNHDFCRESIQAVFCRLLMNTTNSLSA